MPVKKRQRHRAPNKRHSAAEQERILVRFAAASGDQRGAAEAARGLGASLASIYRWRRARQTASLAPPPTRAQHIGIDAAIARLADVGDDDRQTFLEALFKFIAWLRWPHAPGDHPAAMTVCMVTYLAHGRSADTLDQLPSEDLALLLRHIRLDTLRRLCTNQSLDLPVFELWDLNDQPYKETDFLAEIVHFLLAYQPVSRDHRDAPSLSKAYHASQSPIFRYRWPLSHSTFRKYWNQYGAAAPFLYVERFHSNLDFSLDPIDPTFAASVDDMLQQREGLRRHLARCRTAVDLLTSRLDSRAVAGLRFPRSPNGLAPEPIEPPPLPAITEAVMAEFGRRDKRR